MEQNKKCYICKNIKSAVEFYRSYKQTDLFGVRGYCKSCAMAYKKTKLYGITVEEWNELFEKQNGKCAICFKQETLCVDHDHVTDVIRGLLCQSCNRALGVFKDNIKLFEQAIKYLKGESNGSDE